MLSSKDKLPPIFAREGIFSERCIQCLSDQNGPTLEGCCLRGELVEILCENSCLILLELSTSFHFASACSIVSRPNKIKAGAESRNLPCLMRIFSNVKVSYAILGGRARKKLFYIILARTVARKYLLVSPDIYRLP